MEIQSLHHVSLPVTDLDRSRKYYREMLALEELERPPFDFRGAWFRVGNSQQLHLIVHPDSTFRHGKGLDSRDTHFALRVKGFRRALEFLRSKGFREDVDEMDPMKMRVRYEAVAGFPQIHVLDPDRNVIEINADHLD